jgi:hypothetical protein
MLRFPLGEGKGHWRDLGRSRGVLRLERKDRRKARKQKATMRGRDRNNLTRLGKKW